MEWGKEIPKWPTSTKRKKTGTNLDLEKLTNLKFLLDPQRIEWQIETTGSNTKYKSSKDLITDLEHKHSNLQTKHKDHLHSLMQENQTQKAQVLDEFMYMTWRTYLKLTESCHKQSLTSNQKSKKWGQENPNRTKEC